MKTILALFAALALAGCFVPAGSLVVADPIYVEDGVTIDVGHEPPGWCSNHRHRCYRAEPRPERHVPGECCGNGRRHHHGGGR